MSDLITATEYNAYANTSLSTTAGTTLPVLVTAMSLMIRRACGRDLATGFESATWTQRYGGSGAETIQLSEWPAASITSITAYSDSGDTVVLDTGAYRLDGATGIVYMLGAVRGRFAGVTAISSFGWSGASDTVSGYDTWGTQPNFAEGFNNYSIVYVTSAGVPVDVKYAAYRMTDFALARKGSGLYQSEDLGGYKYVRASMKDQGDEIDALLRPFLTGGP